MSTSDLMSGPCFKPEFHSWILIPDTASFRKESSEESPTNAPSSDGCPEATATSDEAPETSTVNAESVILGTIGGLCSSPPTSPLASSCELSGDGLSSSSGSELLIPSWPLALPRPCAGALDALEGVGREERIARVICYGGGDADGAPDASSCEADSNRSVPPPSPSPLLPQLASLDSMGRLGRPLAIFAALLASHLGVLVLGMYLGGRQCANAQQTAELSCLLRRFSSGSSGWQGRICAA